MSRNVVRLVLVAMVSGALVAGGLATPASAKACPDPAAPDADGRIRRAPGGEWVGAGVYGPGQTVGDHLLPGGRTEFTVRYRNVKQRARGIEVRAFLLPEGNPDRVRISAFVGTIDVTAAVFGDGVKLPGVAPGASTPLLRFTAKLKKGSDPSDYAAVGIVGNYGDVGNGADPACGDPVGFATSVL
jgi:hypothetical protein